MNAVSFAESILAPMRMRVSVIEDENIRDFERLEEGESTGGCGGVVACC